MLEKILEYERELFFLINSSHSPFWDQVMWLYSGIYVWIPFLLFFGLVLVYRKETQEWLPVLISLPVVAILCMLFSSFITKPLFARPRPVFHPSFMEEVRTLYETIEEPYGFVSGHSASTFGIAMFTAILFRNRLYSCVIFLWALIMAYSRVYLGMHFISDIVAGALAGIGIGFLVYLVYGSYIRRDNSTKRRTIKLGYPSSRGALLAVTLVAYIVLFTVFSGSLIKFLG